MPDSAPTSVTVKLSDVPNSGLHAIEVGGEKVLLAEVDGEVYAMQAKCPHAGALLEKGVLSGHRLVCPWHHACFDVRGGQLLEPPALEDLKRYEVTRSGDEVRVTLAQLPNPERPRPAPDGRSFVIVGGGAAGEACAQTLRRQGFGGRVTVLSADAAPPYDRTNLSKRYLAGKAGADSLPLRAGDWYAQNDVALRLNAAVERVDPGARELRLAGGETLAYDGLLFATGGVPRELKVPGADLGNVLTLRTLGDVDRILDRLSQVKNIVIVGSSFIGLEVAASLRTRGDWNVSVVGQEEVPFGGTLGAEVGRYIQKLHEEHGVTFKLNAEVERFEGAGDLNAVVLKGGERLPADLVLLGIGVRPATGPLPRELLSDHGEVTVDARMRAAPNLYAAGDITRFPDAQTGDPIHVEHWRLAQQHGRTAALNLLGSDEAYAGVPYFWTFHYGQNLRYSGHAERWDETVTWGDVAKGEFVVFYARGGQVRAAAGLKRDTALAAVEELLRLERMPGVEELRAGEFDLAARLR